MIKKTKQGRGALVRRLRREYGLTEGDARLAAEGGGWGTDDPDVVASRLRDQNQKLNRGGSGPRTSWFDRCQPRPAGWCIPAPEGVLPEVADPPVHNGLSARRRLSSLTALALALSAGVDTIPLARDETYKNKC